MTRCKKGTRKDKSGNCVAHNKSIKNEKKLNNLIPKKKNNKMEEVYVVGYLVTKPKNIDYINVGVFTNKENAITELVTTLINKNIINYSQYADYFSEDKINIYNPEQEIEDKLLLKIEWTNKMIEIVNSISLDSFNKHIVEWDLGLFELKCIKTYVV
jgi:hypothetical protein